MSRELRKVSKGWEHPKKENGSYQPMHEWSDHSCNCEYCSVNNEEDYMPKPGEEFGYALYEGISEGTPLTPVFDTKEQLIAYLVKNGDFWGEKWTEQSARSAVEKGYTPSGMLIGGRFLKSNQIGDYIN